MTVSYQSAADMAIILNYGAASESVVSGLNQLGLPGLERSVTSVQEFRNDFDRKLPGGATTTPIPYAGNYVGGDTNGLDALRAYCKANTKFTTCRLYWNYITNNLDSDFTTCDTYNDNSSGFYVSKHTPGQADINGVIPFSGEMVLAGQYAEFTVHYSANTIAFVDSNPDTITDSASGFVTAGFYVGQVLIAEGTSNNDGFLGVIATVAAGTITFDTAASLTAEAAGTTFTIHGGI